MTLRFDQDSFDDLFTEDAATGRLWLYPGTSSGGSSWSDPTDFSPHG